MSASIKAEVKGNTYVFEHGWWTFKPMVDEWQHTRLVISIDGTILKGRYNGMLLIATGSNLNNQQY